MFSSSPMAGLYANRLRPFFASPPRSSSSRRGQLHAGTARLRQTNGNRLFGRGRAVLAFADVVHLLFHEFAGLGAGRFSLARIFVGALQCFFLWHRVSSSYLEQRCRIRSAGWTTLTLRAAALTCLQP